MTYEELINVLIEKAQTTGQATAQLGKDWVMTLSAEKLRALLTKAEANKDGVVIIVTLAKDSVTNGNLPN
jgi:hypothetical protein